MLVRWVEKKQNIMSFFVFGVNIASLKIFIPKSCLGGRVDRERQARCYIWYIRLPEALFCGGRVGKEAIRPWLPWVLSSKLPPMLRVFLSLSKPWDAAWCKNSMVKGIITDFHPHNEPETFLSSREFWIYKGLSWDLGLFLKYTYLKRD